ncbi:hypothetical protein CSV80_08385 [Sporosarcina sp. P12(2017)]|uniref:DUF2207 domain-containing protein n=1 Tax=unclassified Sporosarcina TaxID=2647733 RepID=UPI000C167E2A|nr:MULTISPECIES: DUF2207 domain-containing protein [unclassified Sporosarcina]PIC57595.1 hypothetical protein CSV81_08710 [Sporosarcina sp. P10]PIC60978.1 hypothetical protein CSV80_08385 [Sporosarcina sp. P12(2017)]
MKWKLLLVALLAFLVLPTTAGAVDFSISDVKINAQLEPDGTVQVKEQHMYDFDSEFNGIIREIQPKRGASIKDFTAFEKGKELEIEKRDTEYRVHRKGDSEVMIFDLQYTIRNGMEKYNDGAQFYWPFFDRRNETDYGNMTIAIMPPSRASDVMFIGYDSAENTGKVQADGTVVFSLGEVRAGDNGDIRVVYESSLFPEMIAVDSDIRPTLKKDQEMAAMLRQEFIQNQKMIGTVGSVSAVAGILGVGFIGFIANTRRKRYVKEAHYQMESNGFYVPLNDISLPALLLFKNGVASVELMSAALLDLVRKGNVKQLSDEQFELVDANVRLEHEKQLIQLLFFQIGHDQKFTLSELKSYTKEKKNYEAFDKKFVMWKDLLKAELNEYDLKVKTTKERVILSLIGVLGIGFAISFINYELYVQLVIVGILTLVAFGFALFYSPYNYEGTLLKLEWDRVGQWMKELDTKKWEGLSLDDRFRVLIYGVGVKHPELDSYYKDFVSAQKLLNQNRTRNEDRYRQDTGDAQYENSYYGGAVYNPVFLAGSFNQASSNVSNNAPSSDSSSGGGGTGGGGGGSGAF